jgi:chorismate dehydratase
VLDDIDADAMLLIGDAAMKFQTKGPLFMLDLGEEWKAQTGLPFVYAVWVVRADADVCGLAVKLARAREEGLRNRDQIAQQASHDIGLHLDVCLNYLHNVMQYDLGEREIEALELFQKLAAEDGLCPGGMRIEFEHR